MLRQLFLILLIVVFFCPAQAEELPSCMMHPIYVSIPLPEEGFIDIFEREMEIPCETIPADSWTIKPSNQTSLFVRADGPGGSGHYWTITGGIGEGKQPAAMRGVCIQTSTIGWRTLQQFKSPLVWNGDLNDDGKAELIIWDSFPLHKEASPTEFALIAWVYQLGGNSTLELDLSLSRDLALDIARSYRVEIKSDKELKHMRNKAANALEAFGREKCAVEKPEF